MQEFGVTAAAVFGAAALFLLAWRVALRNRRKAHGAAAAVPAGQQLPVAAAPESGTEPLPLDPAARRLERRMEEIEAIQADLAERFAEIAEGGAAAKLQAMAGSLLNLVRDKDATLETALAGLDGLRARLKTLEAIGDLAEARALFDGLKSRLDAIEAAQAQAPAVAPVAELAESLARLHGQKEAAIEAVLARLGPLEAKLGEVEGRIAGLDPQGALDRFAARLEAVRAELAARIDEGPDPVAEIARELARLHAQKDATVETVLARLGPLEAALATVENRLGGLAPQAAVERFTERLEAARTALQAQIDALRTGQATPAETPFAELSEALARLAEGRDAALETVLGRLGPLEAALRALEDRVAGLDPEAALARFAERLEAVQGRVTELGELDRRLGRIEGAEDPVAAIAARFAELQERKDAATETVLARLGPLEAGLAALEARFAAADPADALARLDARLTGGLDALASRITALDTAQVETARAAQAGQERAAALLERLDRLQAEREAATAALDARLAPLEARMADLEVASAAGAAAEASLAALADELAALRGEVKAGDTAAEARLAALSETLAGLDSRQAAAAEAAAGRLAALEAAQAGTEGRLEALDPETALARIDERLEALRTRMATVEEGARAPMAELAEQFGRLHAEKDAGLAALLGRIAPLEAQLAGIEARLGGLAPAEALARFAERVAAAEASQAALEDRLAGRIEALEQPEEDPLATLRDAVAGLKGDRDAALEAVTGQLAALEAALGTLETRTLDEVEARAEAQAIAAQMVAAQTVAEETRLFADRISLLEASLPRLTLAQSLMMQALERQAAPAAPAASPPGGEANPAPTGELDAIWRNPRVISLHQSK